MQYQYKVISATDPGMLEEALNAAGEEGYGLVSVTPKGDGSMTAIMEFAIDEGDEDEDDEESDEETEE